MKDYSFFGCRYPIDHRLNEKDKSTLMMALYFHPRRDEKIGIGAQDIKVYTFFFLIGNINLEFWKNFCFFASWSLTKWHLLLP